MVRTEAERWKAAVEALRRESPRHGKSLTYARFYGFTPEGNARLTFPPEASFHRSTVFGLSRELVETALSKHLGRPTKLVEEGAPTASLEALPKSIAEQEASERQAREQTIEAKVRDHASVRTILRVLGGSIEHIQFLEPAPEPETPTPSAPRPDEE